MREKALAFLYIWLDKQKKLFHILSLDLWKVYEYKLTKKENTTYQSNSKFSLNQRTGEKELRI